MATTVNCILAHFVMTSDAKVGDLYWLFDTTPAHIAVVTYDLAPGEKPTEIAASMGKAVADHWHAHWVQGGVFLGKKARFASVELISTSICGPHLPTCLQFVTLESRFNPRAAVAVAALFHDQVVGLAEPYDNRWLDSVRRSLADYQVRFLAGVPLCPREQVEALLSSLNIAGSRSFSQSWWTKDPGSSLLTQPGDEEWDAVAANFGVRPEDAMYVATYPAYVVMLGPCKDVVVPNIRDAPWWPEPLFP